MVPRKTLAEQLAMAANPEPQDFDPEDFENRDQSLDERSDSESGESDVEDRTSHYVAVGRSKMRDDGIALSEGKYKGSRISRNDIEADSEDEDESQEELQDESTSEQSDSDGNENELQEPKPNSSAGISQISSAEQKTLLNRLSTENNGDVEKGKAVSAQMKVYEGLLDLRIQTQKVLNETNKLSRGDQKHSAKSIYPLLTRVIEMRKALSSHKAEEDNDASDDEISSSSSAERNANMDEKLGKQRESVLTKWSRKVELSSGRNALQSSKFRSLGQSSALQVSAVLNDMPRLIKRTQVDRSNYGLPEGSTFSFDDTDFYRLLLKDLVDRRMADGASGTAQGLKWKAAVAKQKKKVDTKASKGRKLRYTVMEKIQGFDAPRNVFKWTDQQAEDLYAGLSGVRISMDDNEAANTNRNYADRPEGETEEVEVGDFNLFG